MSAGDLERWRAEQAHYQDERVARGYDAARFTGARGAGSTARKWNAIRRALGDEFERCATFLDVPCGTGRFAESLASAGKRFVGADLSHAMLGEEPHFKRVVGVRPVITIRHDLRIACAAARHLEHRPRARGRHVAERTRELHAQRRDAETQATSYGIQRP